MARWLFCLLLGTFLMVASVGTTRSAAQERPTPLVTPTDAAGSPARRPWRTPQYPYPALTLTLADNGGTFRVPVNSVIALQIPRGPRSQLVYDPSILQVLAFAPTGDAYYPLPWRLRAVRPGATILAVEPEPCYTIPCPELPSIQFRVTIVVSDNRPPLPPPPVVPPNASEMYIGTAYLNQTIRVQVGEIVVLDLPSLDMRGPVQVQFDPAMLRPLPGQMLTYPQPGGWRFQVVQPGTSSLTVQGNGCPGGGSDCPPTVWFQVTLTTEP